MPWMGPAKRSMIQWLVIRSPCCSITWEWSTSASPETVSPVSKPKAPSLDSQARSLPRAMTQHLLLWGSENWNRFNLYSQQSSEWLNVWEINRMSLRLLIHCRSFFSSDAHWNQELWNLTGTYVLASGILIWLDWDRPLYHTLKNVSPGDSQI